MLRALGTWLLAVGPFVFSGCRLSYELLAEGEGNTGGDFGAGSGSSPGIAGAESGGSGGTGAGGLAGGGTASGGTASGGTASGGTASGGTASGGTASGGPGDFHVTTGVDELDGGATVDDPGGSGLSLREAIVLANGTAGSQTITFEPGIVVGLQSILPTVTDPVHLRGDGVRVDASGMNGNTACLVVAAGPSIIENLELHGCRKEPISIEGGSGSQVRDCHLHGNGGALATTTGAGPTVIGPGNRIGSTPSHAISIYSPDSDVVDNLVADSGGNAVFIAGPGSGARVVGNVLMRGQNGIGLASTTQDVAIWHNTIVYSTLTAVVIGQASGVDVRNNILVHSGSYGLSGTDDKFVAQSHNLFFGNGMANCSSCTLGPTTVLADPEFTNPASDDFTLLSTSPAIDAGVDTGSDRNGSAPASFNGVAPDIGAFETE